MCNFRLVTYNNANFRPVSAEKLICTSSGQPIRIRLKYGNFCDNMCGLDEAKAMFEQIRDMGKTSMDKIYGLDGCDSHSKTDNARKPTHITTHLTPSGNHYIIR